MQSGSHTAAALSDFTACMLQQGLGRTQHGWVKQQHTRGRCICSRSLSHDPHLCPSLPCLLGWPDAGCLVLSASATPMQAYWAAVACWLRWWRGWQQRLCCWCCWAGVCVCMCGVMVVIIQLGIECMGLLSLV